LPQVKRRVPVHSRGQFVYISITDALGARPSNLQRTSDNA
jgi:hypothetical protein